MARTTQPSVVDEAQDEASGEPVEASEAEGTTEATESGDAKPEGKKRGRKPTPMTLMQRIKVSDLPSYKSLNDGERKVVAEALKGVVAFEEIPGVTFNKVEDAKEHILDSERSGEFLLVRVNDRFKAGTATKFFIE